MGFPVVTGRASNSEDTPTNSFDVELPEGIVAGELLLVVVVGRPPSAPVGHGIVVPEGWEAFSTVSLSSLRSVWAYRIADGSEGGSVEFTSTPVDYRWAARSWRIKDHSHGPGRPPAIGGQISSGNFPDPPSLNTGFGEAQTLWLAAYFANGGDAGPTAFPTQLTEGRIALGTADFSGGVAEGSLQAASLNPSSFTKGDTSSWLASTIAIRPLFPTVMGRASNVQATESLTFNAALPDGVVAGELLLVFYAALPGQNDVPSLPEGWAFAFQSGNGTVRGGLAWKIADGSETTVTFTHSSLAARWVARSWRIANHGHASGAPVGAHAVANNSSPDPPSLSPGWGAANNLWIAAYAQTIGGASLNNGPSGFSEALFLAPDETNGPNAAVAELASNAGTLNPSSFSATAGATGRAYTFAIAPVLDVAGSAQLPIPEADGFLYEPNISGSAQLPIPVAQGFVYERVIRPFRVLQHLLPRALAWRTTVDKALRRYVYGLGRFADGVRQFIDLVYLDLFPQTTRELDAWAQQFALAPGDETSRRLALAGAWLARGGQSPDYLQSVIHAAGFTTVFVHEWWESTDPFVARDPRDYTEPPIFGEYQCEGTSPWECFDPGPGDPLGPHCDDSLANDPGYLVNLDLTRRPPPPIPADEDAWRYFIYFAGETFPEPAVVDPDRLDELKALLLSLCPAQQWIVLIQEPPA